MSADRRNKALLEKSCVMACARVAAFLPYCLLLTDSRPRVGERRINSP